MVINHLLTGMILQVSKVLCDTTSSTWCLNIVGGCLEAPSLPPLSHLKWFIYGKSRVIQGSIYKKIQGNLGKTEGNPTKSREARGKDSIKYWSYAGDSMIHRASENPPISKEASSSKALRFGNPLWEGIWTPKKPIQKTSKGWEDYTRWAPYQL